MNAIGDINDEPWYDVRRWDTFGQAEQDLGGSVLSANAGVLDSYFKEMTKIEHGTKSEIERVFKDVEEKDKEVANKIKTMISSIEKTGQQINQVVDSIDM